MTLQLRIVQMPKVYDLTGQRFGRLTVTKKDGVIHGDRTAWSCICDCGSPARSSTSKLLNGSKMSCGCLESENQASLSKHGRYGTRAYRTWQNMKTRCLNPAGKFFQYYGGRGITVCENWMTFEGFYEDMGDPPPNSTIDRSDNDLGYTKENCQWRTKKDQSNNRSNNIAVIVNGETKTLKQWAEHFGIKYTTVYWRYKKGWETDRIFA